MADDTVACLDARLQAGADPREEVAGIVIARPIRRANKDHGCVRPAEWGIRRMRTLIASVAKSLKRLRTGAMNIANAGFETGLNRTPGVEPDTSLESEPSVEPNGSGHRPRSRPAVKRRNRSRGREKNVRSQQVVGTSKYRFGFIACSEAIEVNPLLVAGWRTERIGNCVVYVHPEANYLAVDGAAVIGPVVGRGGASINGVLNTLVTAPPHRFASLLGDLVGRFAVIVDRGDGACIFNDAFGSRTVFYSTRTPGIVASHSGLLAEALDASPDASVSEFMKTRLYLNLKVKYLPGDLTPFQDIFGLSPNNTYVMAGRTERYWPLKLREPGDVETFFRILDQSFQDLKRLGEDRNFILGITGGADSRLICAGLIRHAKSFDGVTWVKSSGGYLPEHERPAVEQTITMLAIQHHYIDVDELPRKLDPTSAINSGSLRRASSLNSQMSAISKAGSVFVRGYGGEIIRGFYNIQRDPMKSASPAEFARMFQKRNPRRDPFVLRAFEAFWERANWKDVEQYGYDINDVFYWEHRMGMWGAMMLNYMDSSVESWVGLNSRPLYEAAFGLAPEQRLTKALFAEAIRRFHKPLADVPIFSYGGRILGESGAPPT